MKPRKKAIYVLVSKQLDLAYRSVQGGHCLRVFSSEYPEYYDDSETLVYLDCDDLELWQRKLDMKGLDYSVFHEPDLGMVLTAIACKCDGRMFSKLNLMQ